MIDLKGIGSEGAIVNLIISVIIIYHLYIKPKIMRKQGKDRRVNLNPSPAPGNAVECKQHSKDLTKAEINIKNLKENFEKFEEKNREDHRLMFDKIDRLKNRKR